MSKRKTSKPAVLGAPYGGDEDDTYAAMAKDRANRDRIDTLEAAIFRVGKLVGVIDAMDYLAEETDTIDAVIYGIKAIIKDAEEQ